MPTKGPIRRQAGVTLIELLMFIVIVSIAVAGVLQMMNLSATMSVDPLRRKQAMLIAEGLLEEVSLARFTYCDAADSAADSATSTAVGAGGCTSAATVEAFGPEAGNNRPYDNVNDYVSAPGVAESTFNNSTGQLIDASGQALLVGGYAATVTVTPEALGSIGSGAASAAMEVLRITVIVTFDSESVRLDGYRTRFAPSTI